MEHGNRSNSSLMHFYAARGVVGGGGVSDAEFSVSVPVPFDSYHVLPSCDGLVCFYGSHGGGIHVCNPATMMLVTLPANGQSGFQSLTCGFGFDKLINKHKVIKFSKPFRINDDVGVSGSQMLEVFTIGDTYSWQTVRFQRRFRYLYQQPPVFADGFFYWITSDDSSSGFSVAFFDVQLEMFGLISPPENMVGKNWRMLHLVELGGKLSLVDLDFGEEEKKMMDLWIFDGSWVKEVTIIHPSEPIDVIRPVAVLAGGEILMHGYVKGMGDFSLYDPKLATFKKLGMGKIPSQYCHASPYVQSLAMVS